MHPLGALTAANGLTSASAVAGWTALLLVATLVVGAAAGTLLRTRPWASRRLGETALDCSMGLAALVCVAAGMGHPEITGHWGLPDVVLWSVAGLFLAMSCVAAVAVAARLDLGRPPRVSAVAIPGLSLAALAVSWAVPWAIAAGIGVYGALAQETTVLVVALAAVSWIGLAGMLRAMAALRTVRAYYLELDEALFWREQAGDAAKCPVRR